MVRLRQRRRRRTPAVLEALARANAGYAPSYGADAAMARVTARLREVFEAPEAAVYLVATGTAANALALACLCPPWGDGLLPPRGARRRRTSAARRSSTPAAPS